MLELLDLSRRFGDIVALDGVTFSIPDGEIVGFVGPNGAGKTTTMRIALGVLEPDAGDVRWNGRPIDAEARRRFGYMPEERGLYPKMKVLEQLVYLARLHGLRRPDASRRAAETIEVLGVAERAWNQNTPTPAQMPAAWDVFVNTVGQVTFPLLSYYQPVGLHGPGVDVGVNYRIPLPGGQIAGGVLNANVRNPGLQIQYSTDGVRWLDYRGPVMVGDAALLRSRAVDGRTSRVAPVGTPVRTLLR